MSQIITTAPGGSFPTFGLEVINQGPVILRKPSAAPNTLVQAIGSPLDDIIRPINPNSTAPLQLFGNAGNDTLTGAAGIDTIFGGTGNDTISGGAGNDNLYGEQGNDTISGGLGNDFMIGGDGNDNLSGDDGNDVIFGGLGDDTISGGAGDDRIDGDAGNDNISGGDGNDIISGGAGNDTIDGGSGSDRIIAGGGNDVLIGGGGNDVLTGGGGADTFVFGAGGGVDAVADFNPREDRLALAQSLLPGSGLNIGNLNPGDFLVVNSISGSTATAKLIYERRTGIVYYNPASGSDVPLMQLSRNLPLTASNFQITNG